MQYTKASDNTSNHQHHFAPHTLFPFCKTTRNVYNLPACLHVTTPHVSSKPEQEQGNLNTPTILANHGLYPENRNHTSKNHHAQEEEAAEGI